MAMDDSKVYLPTSEMMRALVERVDFRVAVQILHAGPDSVDKPIDVVRVKLTRPFYSLSPDDELFGISQDLYPNVARRCAFVDGRSEEIKLLDTSLGLEFPVDQDPVLSDDLLTVGSDEYIQAFSQVASLITGGVTDDERFWSIGYDVYSRELSLIGEYMLDGSAMRDDVDGSVLCPGYELLPSGRLGCSHANGAYACYYFYDEHTLENSSDIELLSEYGRLVVANARRLMGFAVDRAPAVSDKRDMDYVLAEILARSRHFSSSGASGVHAYDASDLLARGL